MILVHEARILKHSKKNVDDSKIQWLKSDSVLTISIPSSAMFL